jgi:UMF1 family MFS transporter
MTFWYLTCFFLFSDGYSTMGAVAVIFARTEMGVPYDKLIIAVLISPFASVLGNTFFYLLQKYTRMSSKSVLILLLALMGLVPGWGLLGLVTTTVGLHNEWEIYLFASFYGFLVGALQSYSRVIFSELIPPGDESEFFSLYAITDKGSSWLGPLVQSLLLNATGNSRFGLSVLLAMIWLPIPVIMWIVDIPRGVLDAKAFHADSLEDMRSPDIDEDDNSKPQQDI